MVTLTLLSALLAVVSTDARYDARPVLRTYCVRCHGPTTVKGGLRIDQMDLTSGRDGDRWQDVLEALRGHEMPPEGERQLPGAQRAKLIAWVDRGLREASRRQQAEAASVLRRL